MTTRIFLFRIPKLGRKHTALTIFSLLIFLISFPLAAEVKPITESKEPAVNFIFRDRYFFKPKLKLAYDTRESEGFLFVREDRPDLNSKYAIVTGFDESMIETRSLNGALSASDINRYVKKNNKVGQFMKVPIKELALVKKKRGFRITILGRPSIILIFGACAGKHRRG